MENLFIKSIWFESDSWSKPYDENDDNIDVLFTLSDQTKWAASFFTYQNINTLSNKNKATGEFLNGLYFCATDMILIDKLSKNNIVKVLKELILSNCIELYCTRIESND